MVRSKNWSLEIWPDRNSDHVSIMNNIPFMEKTFTEEYSKQNPFLPPSPVPLKNNFCLQLQLTEQTVWSERSQEHYFLTPLPLLNHFTIKQLIKCGEQSFLWNSSYFSLLCQLYRLKLFFMILTGTWSGSILQQHNTETTLRTARNNLVKRKVASMYFIYVITFI